MVSLLAAMLAQLDRFQRSIAEVIAARLDLPADDEMPVLMAALALAAVRTRLERWAAVDPDAAADDSPVPYLERAVAVLRSLLEP